MNSRCVVPLLLLSLALPACAQRAGASRGGVAAPAARGGFGPSARPAGGAGYGTSPRGIGSFGAVPAGRQNLFPPPGITSTRPVYYSNGIRRYGETGGRNGRAGYGTAGYGLLGAGLGYGLGYGYPGYGYADAGFGYADSDAFDPLDPNNGPTNYSQGTAQDAFANVQPGAGSMPSGPGGGSYSGSPEQEPSTPYAYAEPAAPRSAAPQTAQPAAPPPEEEAVTIVFKDGRPSEQIHNYALTRTTLFITGAHVRSIPVDQIDMAATAKINANSSVDFQLPTK